MKKLVGITIVLILGFSNIYGQKYITKNGHISFFSETPMENIEARNNQVNCALNAETGDFVFIVVMKSFEFEKALMQEHFNENYLESDKFPNSKFTGKVNNISDIDFTTNGEYNVEVEGGLTIHGVTNHVKEPGIFYVEDGVVTGKTKFKLAVADYDIKIPKAVRENIAESLEINVDVNLEELKK